MQKFLNISEDFYSEDWYYKIPTSLPQLCAYDKKFTGWDLPFVLDDKPYTGIVFFGGYQTDSWIYYIDGYYASTKSHLIPTVFNKRKYTIGGWNDAAERQEFYFSDEITFDFVAKYLRCSPLSGVRTKGPWRQEVKNGKLLKTTWFIKDSEFHLPFLHWARDNLIDLNHATDEDITLIKMKWEK